MSSLMIVVALLILGAGIALYEMLRTPAGIEREHRIEQGRIFSKTRTVTDASPDQVLRLLQTDWSWWRRARAESMKDLGDGRKEFIFHPVRYFNLLEMPPAFLVRFDRIERLADGGRRIEATLSGDFDGPAEYSARPGPGGTVVELAWCGAEVRSVLRFAPIRLVSAIHCWRERLGIEGLRDRLKSTQAGA
jgi:hypothetical protein